MQVIMKPLQISQDIIPLSKFKSQASQIFQKLNDENRPVVVTQNGQPAAVLITPEEFDRLQERDRFLLAVGEGLSDSEVGNHVDDETMAAMLEDEFGP
ncbi:MAG: type II toxin-antitoxin system Phd/YefM family antitoxin [Acidobacteriota bacterium]